MRSLLVLLTIIPLLSAQQIEEPTFDVVSIKVNPSPDPNGSVYRRPGASFAGTNVTARFLIRNAYNVQDFEIIGGPSWMSSVGFDVEAKANDSPPAERAAMLQAMLADRFQLKVHRETRVLP